MYRLNEIGDTPKGQYALGQVYARANKRRSGITDALTKQMPKKEYYTAAEYYPKGTEKYDDIMHDAKSEAECPPNRKINMKPVVYNDKGYETTNFGLGIMDYEKSHKSNENKQYTNMNKKQIRLTESDLKQIVKESVNKILNEAYGTSPQKDIKIANRYANAPNPEFDANTNLSWTTEDEYNDIAPEIREIAICFSKIHDIIRSLKIGLNKDKNGSSDIRNMRRGIRPIKPKNSNALVGMDNYLYTLDKIVDKGKFVLHKMTDRIIQNMGLNPKDEPSSY